MLSLMETDLTRRLRLRVKYVALLIGLAFVLLGAQIWLWQMLGSAAGSFHEKQERSQQVEEVASRTKEVRRHFEQQIVYLDQLKAVVPTFNDTLKILERLDEVGKGVNVSVSITGIEEGAELSKAGLVAEGSQLSKNVIEVNPLLVKVIIKGRAVDLMRYVEEVEHLSELVSIRRMQLTIPPATAAEMEAMPQVNLEIIFHLQKESK
jgi:Tfp pilus assembly protein PilO